MGDPVKISSRYYPETAGQILEKWNAHMRAHTLSTAAPDWLKDIQERSANMVRMKGLPTPKLERFKYTNISASLKKNDFEFSKGRRDIQGPQSFVKS